MQIAQWEDTLIREIEITILEYLAERPRSADSVEGIRDWWVFQRMACMSTPRIQAALDRLEAAGLVERVALRGGRAIYRAVSTGAGHASAPSESAS